MALWRFFDYISEGAHNLMEEWYEAQGPDVQAQFDATLLILRATADWEDENVQEFKPLTKEHAGLGEVRFHINAFAPGATRPHRRRFRPVGIWPTAVHKEFILLLGCEKRGRQFIPHDAFGMALTHKTMLEQGRGTTSERV
jgi:hypothetical protein